MPATRNQEREETNQRLESDFPQLAEQVEAQIKKQSSLEFTIKEQGHRIDSMDRAFIWFQGYVKKQRVCTWEVMASAACKKFGKANENNMIEEFSKIKQKKGIMKEYIDTLEELRAEVMGQMPQATEQYDISVFLSGLKRS
ncbi:hypothetical protein M9H77_03588 [Catharanthus roseus]|uniref:Uncharacterized protein n=1 Tax=Catharanthus roseus TaxID=4058 RepID=A0ACC0CBV3_CATRO|nr:hypothetical protein M9H77_03588 [Catharanthus roseus]